MLQVKKSKKNDKFTWQEGDIIIKKKDKEKSEPEKDEEELEEEKAVKGKLIATLDELELYSVDEKDEQGYVLNTKTGTKGQVQSISSIVTRGGAEWEFLSDKKKESKKGVFYIKGS